MSRTVRTARTANVCVQTPGDEGPRPDDPRVLLARILAPFIAEELRRILSDDWIDQTTSPLGRRRHCELARAEAFAASKEGRRWRARRADVEAYITASRTRRTTDARALALPTTPPLPGKEIFTNDREATKNSTPPMLCVRASLLCNVRKKETQRMKKIVGMR